MSKISTTFQLPSFRKIFLLIGENTRALMQSNLSKIQPFISKHSMTILWVEHITSPSMAIMAFYAITLELWISMQPIYFVYPQDIVKQSRATESAGFIKVISLGKFTESNVVFRSRCRVIWSTHSSCSCQMRFKCYINNRLHFRWLGKRLGG